MSGGALEPESDLDGELDRLARHVGFSQGFHLYLCDCEDQTLAQRAVEALSASLPSQRGPDARLRVLRYGFSSGRGRVDEERRELVEQVIADLTEPDERDATVGVLHVLDVTAALRAEVDDWTVVFKRMNEARNAMVRRLVGGVVVMLPSWLLPVFARAAPDVLAIVSGLRFELRLDAGVTGDAHAPATLTPGASIAAEGDDEALQVSDPVELRRVALAALDVASAGDERQTMRALRLATRWRERFDGDRDASRTLAEALVLDAEAKLARGALDDAIEEAARASQLADDPSLRARASVIEGDGHERAGRRTEAIDAWERAATAALTLDDPRRGVWIDALNRRWEAVGERGRRRPSPHDPRSDRAVEGPRADAGAACLPRPSLEQKALSLLLDEGAPLALIGPLGTGKSMLLARVVEAARERAEVRSVALELTDRALAAVADEDAFIAEVAHALAEAAGLRDAFDRIASPRLSANVRATRVLEAALRQVERETLLIIELPDELLDTAGWDALQRLLRDWGNRATLPWTRLRIALTMSSTAGLASRTLVTSPFRAWPVYVGDWSDAEVASLGLRAGLTLSPDDVATIRDSVGRRPALVSAVLSALRSGATVSQACDPQRNADLRREASRTLAHLTLHPDLLATFRRVARGEAISDDAVSVENVEMLRGAGLVSGDALAVSEPIFSRLIA